MWASTPASSCRSRSGASGHVEVFSDPLVECTQCYKRYRGITSLRPSKRKRAALPRWPRRNRLHQLRHPRAGGTEPRAFSGLLKTFLGPVDDEAGLHYLRPETAHQGIFVNFCECAAGGPHEASVRDRADRKSFRNEITPGNFIFRTREFEQMEMEFFVEPGTDEEWQEYWMAQAHALEYTDLGIDAENLRFYEHPQEKLSHYSKRTADIEYRFGFTGSEWGELEGITNRTNFEYHRRTRRSPARTSRTLTRRRMSAGLPT